MADENNGKQSSENGKKLVLSIRARVPVETSQGAYFARHLNASDMKLFAEYFDGQKDKTSTDLRALGERLLKVLVCVDKEADKAPALTDEVYSHLTGADFKALAEGVGQACHVTLPADCDPVEALGSAVFDMMVEQGKRMAKTAAEIKKTLDSSFGSVSATVRAALGENMAGLSAIREGLNTSAAVEAVRKAQEARAGILGGLGNDLTGISATASSVAEALRSVRDQQGLTGRFAKDLASTTAVSEAMRMLQDDPSHGTGGMLKGALDELERHSARTRFSGSDSLPSVLAIPPMPPMPRFEETPMGRAAVAGEESVLQLQEVAGLVGQMTEKLGSMHELFLVKVVPQWVQNLEDSGKTANQSIGLAKQAIYWSIVVTVAMTLLQLGIAQYYRSDDDKQQVASTALVQKQLEASLELNKQLAADSKRLQDELAKLSQSVSALQSPKAIAVAKTKNDKPD